MASVFGAPLKAYIPGSIFTPEFGSSDKYRFTLGLACNHCTECLAYNGLIFGADEVPLQFPYASGDGYSLNAYVHPNCECKLTLEQRILAQPQIQMAPATASPNSSQGQNWGPLYDEVSAMNPADWQNTNYQTYGKGASPAGQFSERNSIGIIRALASGNPENIAESASSLAIRQLSSVSGYASIITPLIPMLIPLIEDAVKAYMDDQEKRKKEQQRQETFELVYKKTKESNIESYRSSVAE